MNLVRTSLLNGIAVFVRMLSLLGINKLLAIYVGPSGYAVVGQFQNAIQMITTFGSGAINTGVTRYTAEYNVEGRREQQLKIWQTAGMISLVGSFITAFLVIFFKSELSIYFLKSADFQNVFIYFGFGLVFFVMNTFLLAILNGKKEIKRYVVANISGSILSVILTYFLSVTWGLSGTLIALGTYQSVAFFSTLIFCRDLPWFKLSNFFGAVEPGSLKKLSTYTVMALASSVFIPFSQILIRDHLGEKLGINYAGNWEAMTRLGSAYLLFITSTLAVYYLPRLSEISDKNELKREVLYCYKIAMPLTVFGAISLYLLRGHIIALLFTSSFTLMDELFLLHLAGDTVKVAGWLLGFIVTAKGLFKTYIVSEAIFSFSYYFLVTILIEYLGFKGAALAYLVNYAGHFVFMFVALRKLKVI